ncbi:MAG TPA: DUF4136 domain-containing protein [Ferruginibacter sp.]|nr:DUF4136 domain-containing protein [Ferruginibacter sp.]
MKYNTGKSFFCILFAGLFLSGCTISSHPEKATAVNFAAYKSFAWAVAATAQIADRLDNDIIDNNIKNSVSRQLIQKGWQETSFNPDVWLDYTIAVDKGSRKETEPVYRYPHTQYFFGRRRIYSIWNPGALVGYRSQNVPFKTGELPINMIDAKTNKLIWQGWAKGEINSLHVTSKDVDTRVKSIFKKFDYPETS